MRLFSGSLEAMENLQTIEKNGEKRKELTKTKQRN